MVKIQYFVLGNVDPRSVRTVACPPEDEMKMVAFLTDNGYTVL